MATLGEVTVPVTFEMTETSKEVLKNAIIRILCDETVINELANAIEQRIASRMKKDVRKPRIEKGK